MQSYHILGNGSIPFPLEQAPTHHTPHIFVELSVTASNNDALKHTSYIPNHLQTSHKLNQKSDLQFFFEIRSLPPQKG